jgi:hypothetical protein
MTVLFLSECDFSEGKIIPIKRFERALFALDTNNVQIGADSLAKQYPIMLPLFTNNLIHDQTNPSETPLQALNSFLRAPQIRALNDSVQKAFPDLSWLEKDLGPLFGNYQRNFPAKPTPEVVTFISEYATDVFTAGDSLCGIGLDMFLGEYYPGYNPEIFPAFIRRQFKPEYIPVRLAKALAQNLLPPPPAERRLLDLMLHNGKLLYIIDLLLPETPDSMKMGYTQVQMEGCFANEKEVWARILDQNLLYSADYTKIRKLIEPSPNAPAVFQEAPGEIGNWVGWQIIKAYKKRNSNASIQDILNFKDAQKFLEQSKYKPKRT